MATTIRIENERSKSIVSKLVYELPADGSMSVVIKLYSNEPRSSAQNRLFHSWCNELSKHFLDHHDEVWQAGSFKELLKRMFLGIEVFELPDKSFATRTKRTRDLKVKPFTEFLEKVEMYSAKEWECMLTRPEDHYYKAMGYTRNG